MKIAVVHDTLNPCGGAERLALYTIKALRELGYNIDLITIEETDWKRVELLFEENFRRYIDSEILVPPFRKTPSIYSRYVEWFLRDVLSFATMLKDRYDLVIVTKQLHVPVFADIIYVHFPDFYPGVENLYYPERYTYNTFLRIYSLPSHIFSKLLLWMFKRIKYRPLILTNSKFSKALIKRWLRVRSCVLYPPVAIEKFKLFSIDKHKENLVVTIGRIERSKNIHLIPLIARRVRNLRFIIVGSSVQDKYKSYLDKLIKDLGVTDRIEILENLNDAKLRELLVRARYYLHTTLYEHFGIAVVEAMAMGAIPIVHKKSGAWTDIIEFGKYGYGYENLEDLTKILSSRPELGVEEELRFRVVTRAKYFSYEHFKERLKCVLIKVLEARDA